jgi:hypothetical protein
MSWPLPKATSTTSRPRDPEEIKGMSGVDDD